MWHTTEIANIMIKIIKKYGYDVFLNRKLCVALCGDLLSRYDQEKKIFQMLFQVGFGEVLDGVPFKTEQELRRGLLRVDIFLQKQAIEQETRTHIIEIIQKSFVEMNIFEKVSIFQPTITKSYLYIPWLGLEVRIR